MKVTRKRNGFDDDDEKGGESEVDDCDERNRVMVLLESFGWRRWLEGRVKWRREGESDEDDEDDDILKEWLGVI